MQLNNPELKNYDAIPEILKKNIVVGLGNFRFFDADFWNCNYKGLVEIRAVPERTLIEIKELVDVSASKIDLKILLQSNDSVAHICCIYVAQILYWHNWDWYFDSDDDFNQYYYIDVTGLDLYYCFTALYRDALVARFPVLGEEHYVRWEFARGIEYFRFTYRNLCLRHSNGRKDAYNGKIVDVMWFRELKLRLPGLYPKLCMDVVHLLREFM
jgi:hypothetical protein